MLHDEIKKAFDKAEDKHKFMNEMRSFLYEISPFKEHPTDCVLWVDHSMVQANEYNPNQVADAEMKLLYKSIEQDGYTQPIVTVYNKKIDKYIIVKCRDFNIPVFIKDNCHYREKIQEFPIGVKGLK